MSAWFSTRAQRLKAAQARLTNAKLQYSAAVEATLRRERYAVRMVSDALAELKKARKQLSLAQQGPQLTEAESQSRKVSRS